MLEGKAIWKLCCIKQILEVALNKITAYCHLLPSSQNIKDKQYRLDTVGGVRTKLKTIFYGLLYMVIPGLADQQKLIVQTLDVI